MRAACIAFEAGQWGKARWRREDGTIWVEVSRSVLAEGLRPQKKPICYPVAGYIAGFLEIALGRAVRVREVACAAVEGEICLFMAEAEE